MSKGVCLARYQDKNIIKYMGKAQDNVMPNTPLAKAIWAGWA